MKISSSFWTDKESPLLLNPRLPSSLKKDLQREVQKLGLPATLWLQSSGTEFVSHGTKLVAIGKSSFLAGAQGCVDFYGLNNKDVWLNALPLFHVGGLAIEARCFLSGAKSKIYEGAWSAPNFIEQLRQNQASWASLVPTQVYDLVQAAVQAPQSLRAILVGGGALSTDLYLKARKGGWPLLPSYGMTETSALIAGAPLKSLNSEVPVATLETLPHVTLKPVREEKYAIYSQSLFSGYLLVEENQAALWKPRPEPFVLDDRLFVEKNKLRVLGRESELVKILGETVNLQDLSRRLESVVHAPLAIVALPEKRKGYDLHLFIQCASTTKLSLDEINRDLLPFQHIQEVHTLGSLPRTELGKIKIAELLRLLKKKVTAGSREK